MDERHLNDDPEMAAGYVLGKLSPEDRQRIDAHLRSCAACREFLDTELRVAAAARRLGRDELRSRLRHRAAAPQRTIRVLAVAATIAVLAGIGVVTRQLFLEQETPTVADNVSQAPEETVTKQRLEKPAPTGSDEVKHKGEIRRDHASKEARASELKREEGALTVTSAAPAAPSLDLDRAKSAPETRAVGQADAGSAYWTEGISQPTPLSNERSLEARAEKKDVITGAGSGGAGQQFLLRQRPAGDLPPTQQQRQAYRNSIPTYIQEQGSQTLMTLFLDSLVDQNELARARVEQRGSDSLVIRMQNQSILYQLPANRNRQQRR